MHNYTELQNKLSIALNAAMLAGEKIMQIYSGSFSKEIKDDGTPITIADKEANILIIENLKETGLPVLSEESSLTDYQERKNWEYYWLIDPIDGTKEFINRNGEFTVNIALINKNTPVAGIINAPEPGKLYFGATWDGAYLYDYKKLSKTDITEYSYNLLAKNSRKLFAETPDNGHIKIAVSRSHYNNKTGNIVDHLKTTGEKVELVPVGSSLKFCLLAEGKLSIYPRFGKTFEWDIAAGHAILKAAGGNVYDIYTNKPVTYNKPEMGSPYFIAFSKLSKNIKSLIRQYLP